MDLCTLCKLLKDISYHIYKKCFSLYSVKQLKPVIVIENLIPNQQSSFRQTFSMIHQHIRKREIKKKALEEN